MGIEKREHNLQTMIAIEYLRNGIQLAQIMTGISAMQAVACVAQVVGEATACLDAQSSPDGAFRETFNKNFDYAYNDHCAYHDRNADKVCESHRKAFAEKDIAETKENKS